MVPEPLSWVYVNLVAADSISGPYTKSTSYVSRKVTGIRKEWVAVIYYFVFIFFPEKKCFFVHLCEFDADLFAGYEEGSIFVQFRVAECSENVYLGDGGRQYVIGNSSHECIVICAVFAVCAGKQFVIILFFLWIMEKGGDLK